MNERPKTGWQYRLSALFVWTSLMCVALATWVIVGEKDEETREKVVALLALVVFLLPAAGKLLSSWWRLTIGLTACAGILLARWLLLQRGFGAKFEAAFLLLTSLWCIAATLTMAIRARADATKRRGVDTKAESLALHSPGSPRQRRTLGRRRKQIQLNAESVPPNHR
jgi:hypothetical protein